MERTVSKTYKTGSQEPDLKWVDKISHLMDSRFRVPGTRFRFGLDPILGLLPGLGDAASLIVSGILIYHMRRYGASRKLVIMMAGNVLLDAVIGSIPVLGNIFDFFSKANDRNIRLLKRHYHEGKYQGSGTGILIVIGVVIVAFIVLLIYGFWKLIEYLVQLSGGL